MNTDKALDKIRKLIALGTNDGATENERETAMRMAHAMMLKHNIDRASVEAQTSPPERREIVRAQYFGRPWARAVSAAIAKLFLCEYIYLPATEAKDTTHLFIGLESNATAAHEFARWLVDSIAREGKRRNRSEGDGRNLWYRSFCVGAAQVIYQRVEAMITDAKRIESEPGTALVVANLYQVESVANRSVIAEKFPRLTRGRTGSGRVNDGIVSGAAYGRTVHLSRNVAPAGSKKLS